jgi:hypothetical protein
VFHHAGHERLTHRQDAEDVGLERGAEFVDRRLEESGAFASQDRAVVDEHVHAPEVLRQFALTGVNARGVGDIERHARDVEILVSEILGSRLGLLPITTRKNHAEALRGELPADFQSDAAISAGNERDSRAVR